MAYPTVAVTGDPVLSDWQVNLTVEFVEQFTDHSPARLRIEFINEASTKREFLFEFQAPFDALVGGTDDGAKVHSIPKNGDNPDPNPYAPVIPRSPVDGCWKLASSPSVPGFGLRWPAAPGGRER